MSHTVCSIEGISKKFGRTQALNRVTLEFQSATVCLLVGANGSGKSTLLRILAGLLRADQGKVKRLSAGRLSYLGHHAQLYTSFSLRENLAFVNALLDCGANLDEELRYWGLESISERSVEQLSKGQLAKAALCAALIGTPQVVLLDEPSSNLDDQGCQLLKDKLAQLRAAGAACLVSSHDLHRFQGMADRAVLLSAGEVLNDGVSKNVSAVLGLYAEANR